MASLDSSIPPRTLCSATRSCGGVRSSARAASPPETETRSATLTVDSPRPPCVPFGNEHAFDAAPDPRQLLRSLGTRGGHRRVLAGLCGDLLANQGTHLWKGRRVLGEVLCTACV